MSDDLREVSDGLGKVSDVVGKALDSLGKVSDVLEKVSDGHGKVSDSHGKVSDVLRKVTDGLGRCQIVSERCQIISGRCQMVSGRYRMVSSTVYCLLGGLGNLEFGNLKLTNNRQFPPDSCPREFYTCDYGACIPLANKCNSKIDCIDESDESSCNYLEVRQGQGPAQIVYLPG